LLKLSGFVTFHLRFAVAMHLFIPGLQAWGLLCVAGESVHFHTECEIESMHTVSLFYM
jgi:hypothetical protein